MGSIQFIAIFGGIIFFMVIFLVVDANMAYNTEKIASVINKEGLYLEEGFDPKEYFESGILKRREDENNVINIYNIINYINLN